MSRSTRLLAPSCLLIGTVLGTSLTLWGEGAPGASPVAAPDYRQGNSVTVNAIMITAAQATQIARRTAEAQFDGKGLNGSPLDYLHADAQFQSVKTTTETRRGHWYVRIPEMQPIARPNGRDFIVDATSGECVAVRLE